MADSERLFIPDFKFIAQSIWELPPSYNSDKLDSISTRSPNLIIVFSWTSAQAKHVAKYTDQYRSLFPASRILVITTAIRDLCFRSSEKKQRSLQPAVNLIQSYGELNGVLVHCFSDGGSHKFIELSKAFHNQIGRKLPCSALCLDSTPGRPRFTNLCAAYRQTLPENKILSFAGMAVGAVVLCGYLVCYAGKAPVYTVVSRTRKELHSDMHRDPQVPTCYIYSKSDTLVNWKDVQDHADKSKSLAIPVESVCFSKSRHCRHTQENSELYWKSITNLWKQAVSHNSDEQSLQSDGLEVTTVSIPVTKLS